MWLNSDPAHANAEANVKRGGRNLRCNTWSQCGVMRAHLSMAMVSLWGNMCTMRALRVSRLVSSWVRCTRRVSSPSWRNKIPVFMDEEEQ